MIQICFRLIGVMMLTASLAGAGYSQIKNKDVLRVIPAREQNAFSQRLKEYINLMVNRDLKEIQKYYDLETLCSLCIKGESCPSDCTPPMPVRVTTRQIERIQSINVTVIEQELISGKLKFRISGILTESVVRKRKTLLRRTAITFFAIPERDNWYFTPFSRKGNTILL